MGRASHVEIDSGNGMLHEQACIPHQGVAVTADELGVDRTSGRVLVDRSQNFRIGLTVMRAGSEIFRDEIVGQGSEGGQDTEESQVRDVFHGSQGEKHVRCIQGTAS